MTLLSFEVLLGSGSLFGARGDAHTALRKLVVPAFTQKAIGRYLPRLVAVFASYVEKWKREGHIMAQREVTAATFQV